MSKKILLSILLSLIILPLFSSSAFAVNIVHYNKGTAVWNLQSGVKCYNIYYKESTDKKYVHAIRCLPNNITLYTIQYLKQNASYRYNVSAVNFSGKEIWWSGEKPLLVSFMQ